MPKISLVLGSSAGEKSDLFSRRFGFETEDYNMLIYDLDIPVLENSFIIRLL